DVLFSFDLSGLSEPVSSYTVGWTMASHSILYGADVTEAAPQAVPEPSTWGLLMIAGTLFLVYRGRRNGSQMG
ncbi:MAG TPA: PEP-CTERM sorting domain-containing protein, partial [Steroidobacteraceae bacterium]